MGRKRIDIALTIEIADRFQSFLPLAIHLELGASQPKSRTRDRIVLSLKQVIMKFFLFADFEKDFFCYRIIGGSGSLLEKCDGIGFQFHFFSRDAFDEGFLTHPNMEPENLLAVYEGFGKLGPPLYITEITIPGSGPDGPAIQAEFVANLYRLWFSIEKMAGITWWNLPDNTAYGNENSALGGLTDENLDPKLAYKALDQLINHEWKTHYSGMTDAEGRCTFQGFAGTYEISVTPENGPVRRFRYSIEARKENTLTLTPEN